ncbi:MAG: hypothetical protein ACKVOU_12355 [Cytophagales bacterium]
MVNVRSDCRSRDKEKFYLRILININVCRLGNALRQHPELQGVLSCHIQYAFICFLAALHLIAPKSNGLHSNESSFHRFGCRGQNAKILTYKEVI